MSTIHPISLLVLLPLIHSDVCSCFFFWKKMEGTSTARFTPTPQLTQSMGLEAPPTHRQLHSTFSLLLWRFVTRTAASSTDVVCIDIYIYIYSITIYLHRIYTFTSTSVCVGWDLCTKFMSHSDWDQWCEKMLYQTLQWCWILRSSPSNNDISVGKTSTATGWRLARNLPSIWTFFPSEDVVEDEVNIASW